MMSSARRIAIVSAEKIDAWLERRSTRTLSWFTAVTQMPCFEPSVKILM
jgi:hypothetical protein